MSVCGDNCTEGHYREIQNLIENKYMIETGYTSAKEAFSLSIYKRESETVSVMRLSAHIKELNSCLSALEEKHRQSSDALKYSGMQIFLHYYI